MTYDADGLKVCTKCGAKHRPTSEFWYKQKGTSDGLRPRCKECTSLDVSAHYKENPEPAKRRASVYQAENLLLINQQQAEYYIAHQEALKEKARNRGRINGAMPRELQFLPRWRRAIDYFGNCCAYCGKNLQMEQFMSKDHAVPKTRGGDDSISNLVPACSGKNGCNNRKSTRDFREFCLTEFGPVAGQAAIDRILAYFEWVKEQDANDQQPPRTSRTGDSPAAPSEGN